MHSTDLALWGRVSRQLEIRQIHKDKSPIAFGIFLAQIAPINHCGLGSLDRWNFVREIVAISSPRLAFLNKHAPICQFGLGSLDILKFIWKIVATLPQRLALV